MNSTVIDSAIKRVTVYREGAQVERTAVLKIADATDISHVTIGDLPACLDDGSVRLSLQPVADGKSAPSAQDFKVSLVAGERQSKDDTAESIRDEMKSIKRDLGSLRLKVEQLDSTIDRLSSVTTPERPRPADSSDPTPNPTDARLQLSVFLADRRAPLMEERRQLSDQREEIEKRLAHLQIQLDEMNEEVEVDAGELKKAVHLRLRPDGGQTAGDVELKLTYLVPGAHWYPAYSLYTTEGADDSLAMHAYVAQHSGEDWTGVTLRLSTAEAQQWTELAELHSLRIGKRQARPVKKGWRAAPAGAEVLFADYDGFSHRTQSQLEKLMARESVIRADVSSFAGTVAELGDVEEELDDESPLEDEEFEMVEEESVPYASEAPPESVAEPPSPAKKLRRAMSSSGMMAGKEIGIERELRMEAEPELLLSAEPESTFLDYHGLRLLAPDDPGRGKLQAFVGAGDDASRRLLSLASEALVLAEELAEPAPGGKRPTSYDGFDFAYECTTPIDVPSQYDFTCTPVLQQSVKLKRRYVTVPREGSDVFRMASVTNPLENPLLAGPMDIYLEGEFFVSGHLEVVAPRGRTEIGLGVEEGVKVARNAMFTETGDGGLIAGNLVLRHELEIELVNNLAHKIDVQVRERIPVTADGDDEVRVEIANVEPKWTEFTGEIASDRGGYAWDLSVPAGKKKHLKAEYRVKISAKNELVGGNRREA